jgi:hypothetical protein
MQDAAGEAQGRVAEQVRQETHTLRAQQSWYYRACEFSSSTTAVHTKASFCARLLPAHTSPSYIHVPQISLALTVVATPTCVCIAQSEDVYECRNAAAFYLNDNALTRVSFLDRCPMLTQLYVCVLTQPPPTGRVLTTFDTRYG